MGNTQKTQINLIVFYLITLTCLSFFANHAGATPVQGTLKWKFKTNGTIGTISSPVLAKDNTIYISSHKQIKTKNEYLFNDYLYALNSDHAIKWKFEREDAMLSSISVDQNGTIYVSYCCGLPNLPYYGYLVALNPDGTIKWKFKTNAPVQSTPAFGKDGSIYFGCDDGSIYALNSHGILEWEFKAGVQIHSSPAVGRDGSIYVGCVSSFQPIRAGNLLALNPNGTLKWKFETGLINYSSPAIDKNGTIYIGTNNSDGYLYAINSNGTLKWKFKINSSTNSSPTIGRDGTIYIGCSGGYLYAVNPDGTQKWKFKTEGSVFSSPAIGNNGFIYTGSKDGYLYALNPNGVLEWKFKIGESVSSYPVIGPDGTVYIGSREAGGEDGYLYAINSSSKMLDPLSPWPKFHKDMDNSGSFGCGYKYYIGDNAESCDYKVNVNSDEYHKLSWDTYTIPVFHNFKAEVKFTVKNDTLGKPYQFDYISGLPFPIIDTPTHVLLPLPVSLDCHYDVNIAADAECYFGMAPDTIKSIKFCALVKAEDVNIKDMTMY